MTKEFLKNHLDKMRLKKELEAEINDMNNMLQSPVITGLPGSHGNHDKVGELVARLDQKKIKLKKQLNNILDEEEMIEEAIKGLTPNEIAVIRYRYIQGLKWEVICTEMNYSWRFLHKIHAKALRELLQKGIE